MSTCYWQAVHYFAFDYTYIKFKNNKLSLFTNSIVSNYFQATILMLQQKCA